MQRCASIAPLACPPGASAVSPGSFILSESVLLFSLSHGQSEGPVNFPEYISNTLNKPLKEIYQLRGQEWTVSRLASQSRRASNYTGGTSPYIQRIPSRKRINNPPSRSVQKGILPTRSSITTNYITGEYFHPPST